MTLKARLLLLSCIQLGLPEAYLQHGAGRPEVDPTFDSPELLSMLALQVHLDRLHCVGPLHSHGDPEPLPAEAHLPGGAGCEVLG